MFELGRLVVFDSAQKVLDTRQVDLSVILEEHKEGKWGPVDRHDNLLGIETNGRVYSLHQIKDRNLGIVTDFRKNVTAVFVPEEYTKGE
jgi:hypothetical protein